MGLNSCSKVLNKPGVYCVLNIVNNKIYVGSSINCARRKNEHSSDLESNRHHSIRLQNSYNKYGLNAFVFKVLEYTIKKDLKQQEQKYINTFKSADKRFGYNMSTSSKYGAYDLTPEIRQKISKNTKDALANLSPESRARMIGASRKNGQRNLGKKRSNSFRLNRSEYLKKNPVKIRKVQTNQGVIFNSVKQAAEYYGVSPATIRNSCKGVKFRKDLTISFSYLEQSHG